MPKKLVTEKMEIFVNKSEHSVQLKKEQKSVRPKEVKKVKDRRKSFRDRRKSVNEGVLVHLSSIKDRRAAVDRRLTPRQDSFKEGPSNRHNNRNFFKAVV